MTVYNRKFQYFNNCSIATMIRNRRILTVPGTEETYPNPLTNFDMDVADAIYTLFQYKKPEIPYPSSPSIVVSFTLQELYGVLLGNIGQRISDSMKTALRESMERMGNTYIKINRELTPVMLLTSGSGDDDSSLFLRLRKEGKRYLTETTPPALFLYRQSFLPLYTYAEMFREQQIVEFSSILLRAGSENHRSIQYIQIRRLLIRRIEWARYHQQVKLYENREIKVTDGTFSSTASFRTGSLPDTKVHIRYQRKTNLPDAGSKLQQETGLLPQLGIMSADFSDGDRYLWRQKKLSVHRDVCQILNVFQELGYIKDYAVITTPAVYRDSQGTLKPLAPVRKNPNVNTAEPTRLEKTRKKKGWEREQLAEEVTFQEFVSMREGEKGFDPEDYRRTDRNTDEKADRKLRGEWLEDVLGEGWKEKYETHLTFIRNRENKIISPRSYAKQQIEWKLLADVLSGDDPEEHFLPENLREREPNLAIYGVTIYKPANKSTWTKRLRKLEK